MMVLQTLEGENIMDWTRNRPALNPAQRIATQHFALYGTDDVEGSTLGPLGGWWTDAKKAVSSQVRSAVSVVADVGRSVAPIVGTAVGAGLKAAGMVPTLPGGTPDPAAAQMAQIPGGQIQYIPTSYGQPQQGTPQWVIPAAIGGGLLLVVLAMSKK
jgi:hypothetical protein